jgi:hypothetical protein
VKNSAPSGYDVLKWHAPGGSFPNYVAHIGKTASCHIMTTPSPSNRNGTKKYKPSKLLKNN